MGVAIIGFFLVWLGQDLARKEMRIIRLEEQRRRDRALFPFFVKLANGLGQFLSPFDTQPGRPPNSFGYSIHEFGAELVTEATCYFTPSDYLRTFGGNDKNSLEHWPTHLIKWRDAIRNLLDEAGPAVDELELRVLIDKFYGQATEISRSIPNEKFYAKGDELLLANAKLVEPIIRTAAELRTLICKKSDRTWSGVDFRYRSLYQKHETERALWPPQPSSSYKFGKSLGSRFQRIRKRW